MSIPATLNPGQLFHDRYQIQRAIRSGGMGEVYRAIDRQSGMAVAVKRMLVEAPEEGADEGALYHAQRFEEECKLLQSLSYPGIPRFVDSFSDGDRRVIVMEFIEGVDLEKQIMDQIALAGQDLPVVEAVEYTIQVARILEYLHAYRPRPIVHRDVKPANIIVRHSDNRLYLVDFGLAREIGGGRSTKTAVGTVGYAPLEQYRGRPSTRTDQYSLGVTLHFMLSGQQPLPLQIEPLDKIKPELPHDLCWAVRKATMQEQEDRFESVYEFRRDLEKLLPALRDFQRQQELRGQAQGRLDLLGPTQELNLEETRPAQRVKIEGVHQEAEEPLKDFGLYHPLQNSVSAQQDFQRQAMQAERQQRSTSADPLPEKRPLAWKSWLAMLALVVGIAALYVLNGRQQRSLAGDVAGSGARVLGSSGFFQADGRIGLGRQGMGWLEYALSFPLTRNDGFRAALPSSRPERVTLVLDASSAGRVPLLVAFVDKERKVVRSYWTWAEGRAWRVPQAGPKGKPLDLESPLTVPTNPSSASRGQLDLECPEGAQELVVLLPQPASNPLFFHLVADSG